MKSNNIRRLSFSIILPVGLFLFVFSQWQIFNNNSNYQPFSASKDKSSPLKNLDASESKQKGAHIFGIFDTTDFHFLTRNNIEWLTFVPWAFQDDFDSSVLNHHNGDSSIIIRHNANWLRRLNLVRSKGYKVFVKPHIWINTPSDGKWRSDIFPTDEENWEIWKNNYRDFILRYATVAEQANAEMFCVGTELSRLSVEKPAFWKDLIQDVRRIYSGKITYAANWYNEYEKITFWRDLDYVGVQAYFPLTDHKYPEVDQISKGWKKHFPALESVQKRYNRKILFTEMGYKSTADSAIKPWEWIDSPAGRDKSYSVETQANCYEAFFNTVWEKEWFAGVHIWQFRSDYLEKGFDKNNRDFTPLGKPAESIIAKGFE